MLKKMSNRMHLFIWKGLCLAQDNTQIDIRDYD
jgi:hypothetical protein